MITCAFAGHKRVYGSFTGQIECALEGLLQHDDAMCCYVTGRGEFDAQSAAAIRCLKKKHKNKRIRLVLALPYMQKSISEQKEYYESYYDEIMIPQELLGVHYKRAITALNRWLVENADCLIAMLYRDYGGAYDMVRYAKRLNKPVILL